MKNLTDEDLIELAKEDLKCSVIELTTFNINVWILGYQKCFKETQKEISDLKSIILSFGDQI